MRGLILTFLCLLYTNVMAKYLDGLDRSFAQADNSVMTMKITITEEEYQQLVSIVQVSGKDVENGNTKNLPDFESKTASIYMEYNGEIDTHDDIQFKTGGMYARSNDKIGFNIKIDEKLMERKSIRLRPDAADRSHMRQKLTCDIFNRAGLPSIQSIYVNLSINDNYFGLYTLMDSVKPFMVRKLFNVSKKSKSEMKLYQCKYDGMDFSVGSSRFCINANTDDETENGAAGDMAPLDEFITAVNAARTIEDLDAIMDVDEFLKYIALEWLIGSFDHLLILGHNFNLYQRDDGKWVIILYDFDNTFGQGLSTWLFKNVGFNTQLSAIPLKQYDRGQNILKLLVHNDDTRFRKALREVMVHAFNPTLLGSHIDEIKSYISTAVQQDLTPVNGVLPGRINKKGYSNTHTFSDFESNSEFGSVNYVSGVKQWIKERYESACKEYSFDPTEIETESMSSQPKSFFTTAKQMKEEKKANKVATEELPAVVESPTTPVDTEGNSQCWSEALGYKCCTGCTVLLSDESGKWGVENANWCGIDTESCQFAVSKCPTNEFTCCSTCEIDYVDAAGRFGYENGEWCNTPYEC